MINENGFSPERVGSNDPLTIFDERIYEGYQISQCGLSFNQDTLSSIAVELNSGTTIRLMTIDLEGLQAR
ncbi:MAG: hypothetical protein AB8G05_23470 [Oligoflexales bacterium]